MAFSNASTSVDDVTVVVDLQENEMPPISTTPSSSMAQLKRPHANADDGQQQKETHAKIAKMEMELRDSKQLGRIRELELEKEFREKFARMEMELKNKELENKLLHAELREQKLLTELNALRATVDKQQQKQLQQKDTVEADQSSAISARVSELEKQLNTAQQKTDQLSQQQNDQQTALCAKIDQLEGKQTANFDQLKATYDACFVRIDEKISFLPQNWWDDSACHGGLSINGFKCLLVHHKGNGKWCRSAFAKHSIRSKNSPNLYFEVKVGNLKSWMAIGLATKAMPLDALVGAYSDSCGYSSYGILRIDGNCKDGSATFCAGDTVGCGVDLANRQIIFTKNGQLLDSTDLIVSDHFSVDSLFPCVTLCQIGDRIVSNFGPDFEFDVGKLSAE